MKCPSCGAALDAGGDRCSTCGAWAGPRAEGSLAPDPLAASPRPLREPPLRKREPSWKDEVRNRVRRRRQKRVASDLPLFPEPEPTPNPREQPEPSRVPPRDVAAPPGPAATEAPQPDPVLAALGMETPPAGSADRLLDEPAAQASDAFDEARPVTPGDDLLRDVAVAASRGPEPSEPDAEPLDADTLGGWGAPRRAVAEPSPVERPAQAVERLQAALVDVGVVSALWAVVVYFAARVARVPAEGLVVAWPYLLGFLVALGLAYASYFTGVTGQTPGKLLMGLWVVDSAGRPPGAWRALSRAALGTVGIALALAGLAPILFDPARRALHDRLLHTRVVRR